MSESDFPRFVSTGSLPSPEVVTRFLVEAYERYRPNSEGDVSRVYPALAQAPADLFGISVVGVSGRVFEVGASDHRFAIMSVAKPFVFAVVCDAIGHDEARARIGVNATGLPFNSTEAIERGDGRTNPMVNAGAIAATSLVPGGTAPERWQTIVERLSAFAGRPLELDSEIYESARESNARNRDIVEHLERRGRVFCDSSDALDLYTRQSCLAVNAHDLAVMGATLADGGVNPITRTRVVSEAACRYTLAAMAIAGLYESSGDWLYDIGLPGKSGIGGGMVAVAPGKGALGTFAPRLDSAGNSVNGQLVARFLARRLGLDMFASQPVA